VRAFAIEPTRQGTRNRKDAAEAILTIEEAIGTVGIARSILGQQMLAVIPDALQTTGAPALPPIPEQ
jgi:hypothetical protein